MDDRDALSGPYRHSTPAPPVPDPADLDRFIDIRVKILCPTSGKVLLTVAPALFKARTSLAQRWHCKKHGWQERRRCAPCQKGKAA